MADAKLRKEIEVLTFKRDSFVNKIESLYNKSQTLSVTETHPEELSEFKVRCERLPAHYESFVRYQNDLAQKYVQLKEKDQLDALHEKSAELDDKYYPILTVKEKLFATSSKPEAVVPASTANLPRINLPIFDGTLKEWPQFKDLFTALVYSDTKLSPIEKFHFLISCTKNEANTLVRSLPICSANFELVWTQLNDRYDNKRILASQYVEEILSLHSVTYENPKLLRNMLDLLTENTMALRAMEIPDDLGNFIILHSALKKLDKHTRQLFERKFSEKEYPTLEDFLTFLKDHCKSLDTALGLSALCSAPAPAKFNDQRFQVKFGKFPNSERIKAQKSFLANTENKTCSFCSEPHGIYTCTSYLNLTPSARRDFIKSKRYCFNCLSTSHMANKCNSKHTCRTCNKHHHTTLHEDRSVRPNSSDTSTPQPNNSPPAPQVQQPTTNKPSGPTSAFSSTYYHARAPDTGTSCTTLLGTALIQLQDSANNFQTVRALLDPGSMSSFITDSCVKKLGLPRSKLQQNVLGLSQNSVTATKGTVSCILKPCKTNEPLIPTDAIVLKTITSALPSSRLSKDIIEYFKDFDLADPQYFEPASLDFLIGANLFPLIWLGGRFNSPPGFPTPFETVYGWVLIGEVNLSNFDKQPNYDPIYANLSITENSSLEKNLKRFWEIEEPPQVLKLSAENKECEEIYVNGHSRDSTGRYIVKLPFLENSPNLGASFDVATKNFFALEKRFAYDDKFKEAYSNFMREYELLGHMTRLDSSDIQPLYTIPHHGVFKSSDPNSKLRVVFNASARTSTGVSLNDKLHVGAKLQNDVGDILFRFRLHPYVIVADVVKMYRQILLTPEDRPYQTIVWRNDPESPLDVFLLNTLTYGVSSAPYLAIRTLRQLVHDEGDKFPLASKAILSDMFVDDCLTGADSLLKIKELKSQLINILKLGSFELGKWASNEPDLLLDVQTQISDVLFKSSAEENPSIKVLGLKWNPNSDIFQYEGPAMPVVYTKRGILSNIAKIFDPLGLINPVIFWAKCLIQKIWTLGLDWDQPLPDNLFHQSSKFFEELPLLNHLSISRLVLPSECIHVELHGFSDASELGYGCAVYLRAICMNGSTVTNLIMAKSKVAPLKRISIPKLELCGALLLSKTMKFCHNAISSQFENIPIFAWTDSTIVLHWIRSSPHLLKTFVANRIADLQSHIDPSRWRHTPTHTNPADSASRGLQPRQIIDNSLWWNGPNWLKEDTSSWPTQPLPDTTSEESLSEFRSDPLAFTVSVQKPPEQENPLFEKFSNFTPLQTCLGWVLRFINNCKKPREPRKSSYLTAEERKHSLHFLVKMTQACYFSELINCLSKEKTCPPLLQRLDPFLDQNGILRVGGRLRNSKLDYQQKHPILLPKKSSLTKLLITHYHIKYLHVGPRTLQSLLSQEFWIISARQIIRSCLSKCLTCHKFNAKTVQPFMGNLPEARLTPCRPFLKVGVDFGGPYLTKSDKLRKPQIQKSYICLFVCLSTKAIHLELVSSLSTDAFLAALNRFVSRRGLCTDVYSDQGTNFVGANRELTELHTLLSHPKQSEKIFSNLASKGISWHFNPASAPNFGGLWEAGIKSTKYHIKRLLGTQTLTFEELSTLLAQIEAILNSRPLCSISSDANEFETLTPGHFLIGGPLVALPQLDFTDTPLNRLSRWQLIQQASRHFWNRWSQEYLHQLQQRQRWSQHQPNLEIGDLVLIKDNNLPPLAWKTGRIIDTHPGADGIVRVVTLRTPQGIFKRPANKLSPLPTEDN